MNKKDEKKKVNIENLDAATFPVFNIPNISTNNIRIEQKVPPQSSKDQIIDQAIKFHTEGNISEAIKYYQLCIKNGFKSAKVFSNFGILLRDLEQLKEAEISIRKAIELNPEYVIAHNNLSSILFDLGKLKEAESSARKAIQLNPDYANAYNTLGNILSDLGKFNEAEQCYSKAISLKPDHQAALINRGKLYFEKKEFEKALIDSDSCNTKESRAFSIEILYSLGKMKEIYKRIDKYSKSDDKNLRLAAFSSFISEREKKDTSYNFCSLPLSFLHFNNLSNFVDNYNEFIDSIIQEISKIKIVWEPPKKTTHNGFQTPSYINLFSESSKNISLLKSIISKELDSYYLKFKKEPCSYIENWPCQKKLLAWHVILKKQGYQDAHIHPDGWLSGVVYLKVVPSLGTNEGGIEFSLNGVNYSDINSSKLTYQPKPGDIIFFPSSLHHRTIPFSTDMDRIVIAFDLMPEGFQYK